MGLLYLVGTVHVDLKGHERLEKILNHHRPSIICLEETPKGATKAWKGHLDVKKKIEEIPFHKLYSQEQIEKLKLMFMSSFYEMWVPKVYKNNSPDIKLYCIDKEITDNINDEMDSSQRLWVIQQLAQGKTIKDLITPIDVSIKDFVEKCSAEEYQKCNDEIYAQTDASDFISRYGKDLFRIIVLERDKLFASQIRKIQQDELDKKIVAILGNMHVFGNYGANTYDLVSDLNPVRIKLNEVDKF